MPFLSPNQQCQSTEGKISHSMDLLIPSSPGVFQLCLWPLIAPVTSGRVAMPLISLLMPVPQDKKLGYRWQTARRVVQHSIAWLPPPPKTRTSPCVTTPKSSKAVNINRGNPKLRSAGAPPPWGERRSDPKMVYLCLAVRSAQTGYIVPWAYEIYTVWGQAKSWQQTYVMKMVAYGMV